MDIHTHMFNLKYLPVAGIIRRYSNNTVPFVIARGIEKFLLKRTNSSFEKQSEEEIKSAKDAAVPISNMIGVRKNQEKIQEMILNVNFNLFNEDKESIISNFSGQLNSSDLRDVDIASALDAFNDIQKQSSDFSFKKVNFSAMPIEQEFSLDVLESGYYLFDKMFKWVISKIDEAMDKIGEGLNFLRWFTFMCNSEDDIFKRIIDKDEEGVSFYLHLMMDVDYFFTEKDGTEHRSSFDVRTQQIPYMAKLNEKYADNLIGFVAFNPSREDCLEIVKDAIEHKGFKGVKFYPPLGYRAADNENEDFQSRIDSLFEYCSDPANDIPVFTHCNNAGFQAFPKDVPQSGYNSNPIYWEKALAKYENLRLCLAHAGGTEGWFTKVLETDNINPNLILASDIENDSEKQKDWNNSYAAMVFKLCVKYKNVYCDAAYLDDMVRADGSFDEDYRKNFKSRLLNLFHSKQSFEKKIMYGSDWHMLFKEGKNEVYYRTYKEFFSDEEFDQYRSYFFELNSKNYLKQLDL